MKSITHAASLASSRPAAWRSTLVPALLPTLLIAGCGQAPSVSHEAQAPSPPIVRPSAATVLGDSADLELTAVAHAMLYSGNRRLLVAPMEGGVDAEPVASSSGATAETAPFAP